MKKFTINYSIDDGTIGKKEVHSVEIDADMFSKNDSIYDIEAEIESLVHQDFLNKISYNIETDVNKVALEIASILDREEE